MGEDPCWLMQLVQQRQEQHEHFCRITLRKPIYCQVVNESMTRRILLSSAAFLSNSFAKTTITITISKTITTTAHKLVKGNMQQTIQRKRRVTEAINGTKCTVVLLIAAILLKVLTMGSFASYSTVGNFHILFASANTYDNLKNVNSHNSNNPYTVLGLSTSSSESSITDKDIRRKYRELCLRYHPDKNRHLSTKQLKECEKRFKIIQEAYERIGTPEARRRYDSMQRYAHHPESSTSSSSYRNGDNLYEELLRKMYERQVHDQDEMQRHYTHGHRQSSSSQSSFFGVPMYASSYAPSSSVFSSMSSSIASLKSVYVHKINIPLQDLYTGKRHFALNPADASKGTLSHKNFFVNIWKRYTAAFRGGIGFLVLYQALLYALPVCRFSMIGSVALAAYIFDRSLPIHPLGHHDPNNSDIKHYTTKTFHVDLLPGYKGGTKFTFRSDDRMTLDPLRHHQYHPVDVVFEIREQRHDTYKRVGNDLHATVTITPNEALEGCTVELEPLVCTEHYLYDDYSSPTKDSDNKMIRVIVPPRTRSGDTILIRGQGWPIRKKHKQTTMKKNKLREDTNRNATMEYGDLLITVRVSSFLHRWIPHNRKTTTAATASTSKKSYK